jgi:DnaJ-class molecular chaperone
MLGDIDRSGWQMSFNDDQIDYMRYLATVPPAEKCYCGWYMAAECPNCKGRGTLADRLKVQCPTCHNYPHLGGKPTITHNIKCSTPGWQPSSLPATGRDGAAK